MLSINEVYKSTAYFGLQVNLCICPSRNVTISVSLKCNLSNPADFLFLFFDISYVQMVPNH